MCVDLCLSVCVRLCVNIYTHVYFSFTHTFTLSPSAQSSPALRSGACAEREVELLGGLVARLQASPALQPAARVSGGGGRARLPHAHTVSPLPGLPAGGRGKLLPPLASEPTPDPQGRRRGLRRSRSPPGLPDHSAGVDGRPGLAVGQETRKRLPGFDLHCGRCASSVRLGVRFWRSIGVGLVGGDYIYVYNRHGGLVAKASAS